MWVEFSTVLQRSAVLVLCTSSAFGVENPPSESERAQAIRALKELDPTIEIHTVIEQQGQGEVPVEEVFVADLESRARALRIINDDSLKCLEHLPELTTISLAETDITDDGLRHLRNLTRLRSLSLRNTLVTDAGLKELAKFTDIQRLDLHGLEITDAGLAELKPLTQLSQLNLAGTCITNAGLEHLSGLPLLCCVELGGDFTLDAQGIRALQGKPIRRLDATVRRSAVPLLRTLFLSELPNIAGGVRGEDLRYLRPMRGVFKLSITSQQLVDWATNLRKFPSLRELQVNAEAPGRLWGLSGNSTVTDFEIAQISRRGLKRLELRGIGLTDTGLAYIGDLQYLAELHLAHCNFPDAGLAHLANLTFLRTLDLTSSSFSDAAFAHLAGLENLRELNLSGCCITDAAFDHVPDIDSLEILDISRTAITGKGLAKLSKLKNLREVRAYETHSIKEEDAWGDKAVLPKVTVTLFD